MYSPPGSRADTRQPGCTLANPRVVLGSAAAQQRTGAGERKQAITQAACEESCDTGRMPETPMCFPSHTNPPHPRPPCPRAPGCHLAAAGTDAPLAARAQS